MSRKQRRGTDHVLSQDVRNALVQPVASPSAIDDALSVALPSLSDQKLKELTDTLSGFAIRDDGWLRLTSSLEKGVWYVAWKFNRGKHAQHYVMVVVPIRGLLDGITLLADKLDRVDLGQYRPSRDMAFNVM